MAELKGIELAKISIPIKAKQRGSQVMVDLSVNKKGMKRFLNRLRRLCKRFGYDVEVFLGGEAVK